MWVVCWWWCVRIRYRGFERVLNKCHVQNRAGAHKGGRSEHNTAQSGETRSRSPLIRSVNESKEDNSSCQAV